MRSEAICDSLMPCASRAHEEGNHSGSTYASAADMRVVANFSLSLSPDMEGVHQGNMLSAAIKALNRAVPA